MNVFVLLCFFWLMNTSWCVSKCVAPLRIALFSLEKFESAVQALQAACQDAGVKVQASRWLRKAQAELDGLSISIPRLTPLYIVDASQGLHPLPACIRARDALLRFHFLGSWVSLRCLKWHRFQKQPKVAEWECPGTWRL